LLVTNFSISQPIPHWGKARDRVMSVIMYSKLVSYKNIIKRS